jgi:Arc/MetJ family transcription regulator
MRITIDVAAGELKQIQKLTGQKKKSPAVSQALSEFLKLQGRQKFIERALSGDTDFSLTNEELEARDVYEAH